MRYNGLLILAIVMAAVCSCGQPELVPEQEVSTPEVQEPRIPEKVETVETVPEEEKATEPDETVPSESLTQRKDIPLTRTQAEYAKSGCNAFALNLFKEVANDANMVISPLGVAFDLGMINNGASGNTKAEIDRVLGYEEDSLGMMNTFFKTMMENANEIDPSTSLEIANAAVLNSSHLPFHDGFKNAIESYYFAELFSLNFLTDDVMGLVNSWCDEKTHGLIPSFLNNQPSNQEYAHFLNALYFKGIWSQQFKKGDTMKEPFTSISDERITVDMMYKIDRVNYVESDQYSAVSLPFGNKAFQMVFILPQGEADLDDMKDTLNLDTWNELISGLHEEDVFIKIPSFEINCTTNLRKQLYNLGVKDAFTPYAANFRLLTDEMVVITDVIQKAVIKVDEQGSEAAAVTDVEYGSIASEPETEEHPFFHANRPFIYAITEVSTGAIFFIGQYTGK